MHTLSVSSPNYFVSLYDSATSLWKILRNQELSLLPKSKEPLTEEVLAKRLADGGIIDLYPINRSRWRYRVQAHPRDDLASHAFGAKEQQAVA